MIITITIVIIIIILNEFSEIDFVRTVSTVPASKDSWPVGSITADSTPVLFAPPPQLTYTTQHTLYST
jgi:hypothetical protein